MKFKNSHTVDTMIQSANGEDDGYFELSRPGSNNEDAVGVRVRRNERNQPSVTWWRKPPTTKKFVEITRSAAERVLDSWRVV